MSLYGELQGGQTLVCQGQIDMAWILDRQCSHGDTILDLAELQTLNQLNLDSFFSTSNFNSKEKFSVKRYFI